MLDNNLITERLGANKLDVTLNKKLIIWFSEQKMTAVGK